MSRVLRIVAVSIVVALTVEAAIGYVVIVWGPPEALLPWVTA